MRLFAIAMVSGKPTGGIKYNTSVVIASSEHEAVGMGIEMCRQAYPHNVNHSAVAVEVEFRMIASTVHHMPEDERMRLMELVAAYDDTRGPK